MSPAGFVTREEKSQQLLVLVVDKTGIFGEHIAEKLHKDSTTVLVTAKHIASSEQMIVVPYAKVIPEIPEGNYSHMFFVWDGKSETLHVLEPLLQKAAADRAQFIFITDYHFYHEKIVRFIHQEYKSASLVFTGDVFGQLQYVSQVTKFFTEAKQTHRLALENVGLRHLYPVFFPDVVEALLRLGFGTEKGKIFLALPEHGITELRLAHILQQVDPIITIDFKKEEQPQVFLPQGIFLFGSNDDSARKLQDSYTDIAAGKEISVRNSLVFSPLAVNTEKKAQKKKTKKRLFFFTLLLLLLVSPLIFLLFYLGLGGIILYASSNMLKSGHYQEAEQFAKTATNLFSLSSAEIQYLRVIPLGNTLLPLSNLSQKGSYYSLLLGNSASAVLDFSQVAKGKSQNPDADFLSGLASLKNIVASLQTAPSSLRLDGISLASLGNSVSPLSSMLDVGQSLFGFPKPQTYLVLFQNNAELRPGGGFIGSYALITLNKGRLTALSLHDVYDADGQLKGHIEPPFPIRRYIPQQNWFLRDSNFDVAFSQDGANAAYFLKAETGQTVDGVIGVDLTFVKNILALTGPVYVVSYNQTVTASNFFALTESHAQKNSFAGSTQKKDFLTALFSAMQNKVTDLHSISLATVLPLISSIKSKDVVFSFSDPLMQDVFSVNGLSSSLWDGRKAASNTINDFTGINEANLGVNKANYFVTRSVAQSLTIANTGSISGVLHITYTNNSQKGVWPGGVYKNYLRVLLPLGTNITSIVIDGKVQTVIPAVTKYQVYEKSGFIAPIGLEVNATTEAGKQLFGFLLIIPEQTTQHITVSYSLPQKINTNAPTFTYNGWLFKQPGVDEYPYAFALTVPNTFSLLQKPSWLAGQGSAVSFTKSVDADTQFSLQFAHN